MRIACVFVCLCLSGCVGNDWSPIGTYHLIQVWKQGDCGLSAPRATTVTVSIDPPTEGYVIESDLSASVEGTILRESDECLLSFSLMEPNGTGLGFLGEQRSVYNITDRDGSIEGAGQFTVGPPENCLQAFTVEGDKIGPIDA